MKYTIALLFLTISFSAFGQILNIEKARLDSLEKGKAYRINLETKFNFYNRSANAQEQARFTTLTNELNAVYAPGKHAFIALGNLAYTENNSKTILNNGYFHLRTTFNYTNRWSQEVFGQVQYDNFRGLTDRFVVGGAIRWTAIHSDKFTLGFGSGPMYEYEIWRRPGEDELENVNFAKLSTNLIVRWDVSTNVFFNTTFYHQIGSDNSIDGARNRLSSDTNFNFKISKFLTFTTNIAMQYEDKPIIDITKFIYGVENGLTLTF